MAVISFNIEDHTALGLSPNDGHVVFTPTQVHTHEGGVGTVRPFTVKYDKSFTVELENTSAEWLWKISVNSPTPIIVGYYAVTSDISFKEMLQTDPGDSWWVKLNQLIDMGGGPAGKDGKDGKDGVNGKLTTLVGGTVTKLPPGSNPAAQLTGTPTSKVLNLGLVTGDPGKDGSNVLPTNTAIAQAIREPGEAQSELTAAIVSATRTLLPEAYGAIGDGVSDDYPALQAMLDAASAGDICDFGKAGRTYNLSATLIPKAGSTLRGHGAAIRAMSALPNAQHIRINVGINGVTIENLVFIESLATLDPAGYVIRCDGSDNRILGNTIEVSTRYGIGISGTTALENLISDNRLARCGITYAISGASRTTCANNVVLDAVENGLSGTGNHATASNLDCRVEGNTVINAGRMGIEDWGKTRRTIIRDNYVEDSAAYNISAVGGSAHVTGNRAINPVQSASIEVSCAGTVVDGNYVSFKGTEESATGIIVDGPGQITDTFGCVVSGNHIINALDAIRSANNVGIRGAAVVGNTIENWRKTGISFTKATISGNQFLQRVPRAATRQGITVGDSNVVTGNHFTYEASADSALGTELGIQPGSSSSHSIIMGNKMEAAYAVNGIGTNGATPSNVSIIGNTAAGSATFSFAGLIAPVVGLNTGAIAQGNNDARASLFAKVPVVRPDLNYSRAGETPAEAQIRAALTSIGAVTDSTVA